MFNMSKSKKNKSKKNSNKIGGTIDKNNVNTSFILFPIFTFTIFINKYNYKFIQNYCEEFNIKYAVITHIERINMLSRNAFLYKIPYKIRNIEIDTILKSSLKLNSDNLCYEGLVGQVYINKICNYYPCFLYTYKFGYYKTKKFYENLLNNTKSEFTKENFEKNMDNFKNVRQAIEKSCDDPFQIYLLIQYYSNVITLKKYITVQSYSYQLNIIEILYQIYAVLDSIRLNFTHYDLHADNIIIFNLNENEYIVMNYHYKDGTTVSFNSSTISKIIDYGRSYFKNDDIDSKYIFELICTSKSKNCKYNQTYKTCGMNVGYGFLNNEPIPGMFHNIQSGKNNISHDLRLLHNLKELHVFDKIPLLKKVFDNLVYDTHYGTKEISKIGIKKDFLNESNYQINNVRDIHYVLYSLITKYKNFSTQNNDYFKNKKKIGEINIWLDQSKPIVWIPNSTL